MWIKLDQPTSPLTEADKLHRITIYVHSTGSTLTPAFANLLKIQLFSLLLEIQIPFLAALTLTAASVLASQPRFPTLTRTLQGRLDSSLKIFSISRNWVSLRSDSCS